MRIVHVLRKPLSEGTVASNVVKHGCGGLNIDASRIGTSTRTNASKSGEGNRDVLGPSSGGGGFTHGTETVAHNYGRWPANVILQHLDGCRCDGVKRVKATSIHGESIAVPRSGVHHTAGGHQSVGRKQPVTGHADKDGKETVANWICEAGCPVARLDEQSGVLRARGNIGVSGGGGGMYGHGKTTNDFGAGDTGGASRFYKQVGGKSDG